MPTLEIHPALQDPNKSAQTDRRRLPFSFATMCGLLFASVGVAAAVGIAMRNLNRRRPGPLIVIGAGIGWCVGYMIGRWLERFVSRSNVGSQPMVVPQSWVFFGSVVGLLEGLVAGALLHLGSICTLNAGACFGIGWGVFVSSLTWRCCQRLARYQSAILLIGLLIEGAGCAFFVCASACCWCVLSCCGSALWRSRGWSGRE